MIVPEQYTEAGGVVCKCLSHLANKKREERAEDYELDYEVLGKTIVYCTLYIDIAAKFSC